MDEQRDDAGPGPVLDDGLDDDLDDGFDDGFDGPGGGWGEPGDSPGAGRVVLAATPIGNPGDASQRLRDHLATADVIAAEDTRRLRRLCSALDVAPAGRVISYHEHNEVARTPVLVERVAAGATVLLVTDAGMPSVSDPGYRLVRACADADLPVTALPGPSAALTALALSGLPSDRFAVEGFPPRRPGQRERALRELADERRTLVFFESPHRTAATLAAMAAVFGERRPGAVCRELTKTYEEVVRGTMGELAAWAAERVVRGEVCLVVGGVDPTAEPVEQSQLVERVLARVSAGERLKDAVREVAREHGAVARELYAAASAERAAGG